MKGTALCLGGHVEPALRLTSGLTLRREHLLRELCAGPADTALRELLTKRSLLAGRSSRFLLADAAECGLFLDRVALLANLLKALKRRPLRLDRLGRREDVGQLRPLLKQRGLHLGAVLGDRVLRCGSSSLGALTLADGFDARANDGGDTAKD